MVAKDDDLCLFALCTCMDEIARQRSCVCAMCDTDNNNILILHSFILYVCYLECLCLCVFK